MQCRGVRCALLNSQYRLSPIQVSIVVALGNRLIFPETLLRNRF